MKKKLLSLVLAGAMVASTSVSAFADISQTPSIANNPREFSVTDTAADADITIQGKIADSEDKLPPSTISVTVPTAASFTVDKNGSLIGSNINITSQGDGEIEVMAYKFKDTTGTENINVIDSASLTSEISSGNSADRKKVSLRLGGDAKTVSLVTESDDSKSGIYKLNTTNEAVRDEDKIVGTVNSNKTLTLRLEGDAVNVGNPLTKAVSDTFTLTLKLRKKA